MSSRRRMTYGGGGLPPIGQPQAGGIFIHTEDISDGSARFWGVDKLDYNIIPLRVIGIYISKRYAGANNSILSMTIGTGSTGSSYAWSTSNVSHSGISSTTSENTAKTFIFGASATESLNNNYGTAVPLVRAATQYTFPNGRKGYLGSVGELGLIMENYEELNNALSLIGRNTFNNDYYGASTPQYNASYRWGVSPGGRVYYIKKSTASYLAPLLSTGYIPNL